jgi:hypothetical protein
MFKIVSKTQPWWFSLEARLFSLSDVKKVSSTGVVLKEGKKIRGII